MRLIHFCDKHLLFQTHNRATLMAQRMPEIDLIETPEVKETQREVQEETQCACVMTSQDGLTGTPGQ